MFVISTIRFLLFKINSRFFKKVWGFVFWVLMLFDRGLVSLMN